MWHYIKWVFYTLLSIVGVALAIGIGAVVAIIGASLGSILLGGFVFLIVVLMVKELFEGPDK